MIKAGFIPAAVLIFLFSAFTLKAQSDFYTIVKDSFTYSDSAGKTVLSVYFEYPVFTDKYSKSYLIINDAINLMYRVNDIQSSYDYFLEDYKAQLADNPEFSEIWREEFIFKVEQIDSDHFLLFSKNSKVTGNFYWEDIGRTNFLSDGNYLSLASLFSEEDTEKLNKIAEKHFRKTYLNGDPGKDISSAGISFSEGKYYVPLEFSFTDKELIFYHESTTPVVKVFPVKIPYSELKGLIRPGTFVDKFVN